MTPYFHEITFFSANTFFQLNAMKLFDGDSYTCEVATARKPFVRFKLHQSIQIDQLDITIVLGKIILKRIAFK